MPKVVKHHVCISQTMRLTVFPKCNIRSGITMNINYTDSSIHVTRYVNLHERKQSLGKPCMCDAHVLKY